MYNLLPEIRFKKFNNNWSTEKIENLFTISAGGDIDKDNFSKKKNKTFKYPVYANSHLNGGLYGYSDLFKQEANQITVTGRGSIGKPEVRYTKFYPIIRLLILKPKREVNLEFFKNLISRTNFYIESTGVPQLTAPQISKYKLNFPSLEEQQKIGSFLTSVDDKINLLTKKKELLEQYKKGVMQKIFSQEIRFKDDNGNDFPDWKLEQFSDVIKLIPSKQIKNSNMLNEGRHIVIEQGKKETLSYSDDNKLLYKNDGAIVFGDHTTEVKYIDFDFVPGPSIKILKSLKNDNINYLYYSLSFNNIKPEGYKRHYSILKQIYLNVPSNKEQIKIAQFLSSLDKKIDLVQSQIEKTKEFKKGLLQQMFV